MKRRDDKRFARAVQKAADAGLMLLEDGDGLCLTDGERKLRGDFAGMYSRLKPANLQGELLVRAAKPKSFGEDPLAIDATAGLGEDAFLLAAAGFRVRLYERDEVIAALLADALERATEIPGLWPVVSRMELFEEDSIQAMRTMKETPDIVFLDPMFPKRQKSGLIKKKFQLLQRLESPCSAGEELLSAALSLHPGKVIVKRPLKGECLAGRKPDYSLRGKAIRYDCIVGRPRGDFV